MYVRQRGKVYVGNDFCQGFYCNYVPDLPGPSLRHLSPYLNERSAWGLFLVWGFGVQGLFSGVHYAMRKILYADYILI